MKLMIRILMPIVFMISLCSAQAQQSNEQQTQADTVQQTEGNTVIDLTKLGKTYNISARMELPQVKMFDRRITPDFKEVTADKSFSDELSTGAEEVQFEPITSGKVAPIPDIEALLKKKRF